MYTVKYAADGRLLASGSFDRTIRIWDGPHEVLCLRKHTLPVTQLLWSSEDHTSASILSASLDRTCRLWDVRAGKMREVYDTQGIPQSIAFNHRGIHHGEDGKGELTGSKGPPPTPPHLTHPYHPPLHSLFLCRSSHFRLWRI